MGRRHAEVESVVITSGFWFGRRVLVTGHTGFKGSWLSLMLMRLGATVTGLALDPPGGPQLYHLASVAEALHDIRADIADAHAVAQAVARSKPEIIIHMAAQPLVKEGYKSPVDTFRTNVMGTVNVLEAARHAAGLRVVLVITTDKCYENDETSLGFREVDRLGAADPYSNSKACAELVTACYRASFFSDTERPVAIASVRAGNVIGGGDFAADRIVPDAVRAMMASTRLEVRNPSAIRPWQHVIDPLLAYLMLAERAFFEPTTFGTAWNIGPGPAAERDVAALLAGLAATWAPATPWQRDSRAHVKEAGTLRLDTSKARELLGWSPLLTFDEMIEWTAAWYRTYAEGGDVRPMTLQQIDQALVQRLRVTVPSVSTVPDPNIENLLAHRI
ncbi:MAG: CDP-glucose 4,6-dehydratase [Janthinobacterium lividum]